MHLARASIIAIGTEITTGQITNRNAAWLAQKLSELGAEVVLHEAVADDRTMIRGALDRARALGGLILVTGGLGPTSDDFTREVIGEWLAQPMIFNETAWKKIHDRLSGLGIPVAPSNRQQCYFPRDARVIVNPDGTADAFECLGSDFGLWAFPGPPREVAAVWPAIEAGILRRAEGLERLELRTWQCIGKSESELGEITERALEGSGLMIGYRAHRPFVEIKVWLRPGQASTHAIYLARLETAIGPWVATRQGEDLAQRLCAALPTHGSVRLLDFATDGVLAERLSPLLREDAALAARFGAELAWLNRASSPEDFLRTKMKAVANEGLTLGLAGFGEAGEWALGVQRGAELRIETLVSAYPKRELLDRSRRYAAEVALKTWAEWLVR